MTQLYLSYDNYKPLVEFILRARHEDIVQPGIEVPFLSLEVFKNISNGSVHIWSQAWSQTLGLREPVLYGHHGRRRVEALCSNIT